MPLGNSWSRQPAVFPTLVTYLIFQGSLSVQSLEKPSFAFPQHPVVLRSPALFLYRSQQKIITAGKGVTVLEKERHSLHPRFSSVAECSCQFNSSFWKYIF